MKLGETRPVRDRLEDLSIPEPNSGCVLWLGRITNGGYGLVNMQSGDGRWASRGAHVVAWELRNGPVPAGLVVDHECDNALCINPDHLSVTTQRCNILRSSGPAAINARKEACPRGHAFYIDGDRRRCRECEKERAARAYQAKKAQPTP